MRFRYDLESGMLQVGERRYPVSTWRRESATDYIPRESGFLERFPDYRMETRQALVPLENSWKLSVIWGDATYSDNHMTLGDPQPFVEEPVMTEIGILAPEPNGLWGDPLAYTTANFFARLVACVSRLPSRDWPPPLEDQEGAEAVCDYIELLFLEHGL